MPARARISAISRPKTLRTHNPSIKARSNQKTTRSTPLKYARKQFMSRYLTESEEDEESIQSFVSNKKPVPAPLIPQFLFNA